MVLVELTEKGVGLGIESGYTYAQQKPIVVLAPNSADVSSALAGIATLIMRYDSLDDLAALVLYIQQRQAIADTACLLNTSRCV